MQTKLIAQASTNKMTVSVIVMTGSYDVALLLQVSKPPRPPQLSTSSSQTQSPLQDVRRMSSEERSQLEASLSGVEEVAACLVFTDGSSQLRPTMVSYKPSRAHQLIKWKIEHVEEAFVLTIVWLGGLFLYDMDQRHAHQ